MTPARVLTEIVPVAVPGALPMTAYLARRHLPELLPAVLVGMELFGLSAHVRDV